MILEINKTHFDKEVIESDRKVIIDFWAPWCNPCRMMHPVLDELEKELGDKVIIGKVNIDNDPELATKFGVMSIPTFIVFENGNIINSSVGMQSKEQLKKLLNI